MEENESQCSTCTKTKTCDPLKIFQVIVYDCICLNPEPIKDNIIQGCTASGE